MIDRCEFDDKSVELGVNSSNVQRDYIFGWLLSAIYSQSRLGEQLVLKGGNCLRKACFPFGRFSNDLDFSASTQIPPEYLASELNQICGITRDRAGVEFDTARTVACPKRGADDKSSSSRGPRLLPRLLRRRKSDDYQRPHGRNGMGSPRLCTFLALCIFMQKAAHNSPYTRLETRRFT
jgi:hypothetical protein